jgi:hypothetical protein
VNGAIQEIKPKGSIEDPFFPLNMMGQLIDKNFGLVNPRAFKPSSMN